MNGCTANCALYVTNNLGKPGDALILEGCSTWTASDFAWNVRANDGFPSGTAANPIYIGVDPTWWDTAGSTGTGQSCASAWNRPVFNMGGVTIANPAQKLLALGGAPNQYLIFDNFEWTGMLCIGTGAGSGGQTTFIAYNDTTQVIVKNMFFHGWASSPGFVFTTGTIPNGSATLTVANSAGMSVGEPIMPINPTTGLPEMPGISNGPTISNIAGNVLTLNASISNSDCASTPCTVQAGNSFCVIADGASNAGNTGSSFEESVVDAFDTAAVQVDPSPSCSTVDHCIGSGKLFHAPPIVKNNIIRYTYDGWIGDAQIIAGNLMENIRSYAENPTEHTNLIENLIDPPPGTLVYNNLLRHTSNHPGGYGVGIMLYICPNSANADPSYVFNNVVYDVAATNGPIQLGSGSNCGSGLGSAVVFNNTSPCGMDGNYTFGCTGCPSGYVSCTFQNNHYITNVSPASNAFTPCGSNCHATNPGGTYGVLSGQVTNTTVAAADFQPETGQYPYAPSVGTAPTLAAGLSNSTLCSQVSAIDSGSGTACLSDTTMGQIYSAESCVTLACWNAAPHVSLGVGHVAVLRSVTNPSIGAFETLNGVTPSLPAPAPGLFSFAPGGAQFEGGLLFP